MKFYYEIIMIIVFMVIFIGGLAIFSGINEDKKIEQCKSKGWDDARFINDEWECYNISQGVKDAKGDKSE